MITILAVEDADLVLALQGTLLRREDCRLLTAATADEVVTKAREERPDLVVLDADGWGLEACARLQGDETIAYAPAVLLAEDPRATRVVQADVDAVVAKPVRTDELLRALRPLLPVDDRDSERQRVSLRVTYYREDREGTASTKDVGPDGLFLRTREPFHDGETVRLVFDLPTPTHPTVDVTGRVVRTVHPDRDSHLVPGVGLRFVGLSERDRSELSRFVDRSGEPSHG